MKLATILLLMDNLTNTIRHHIWVFNEAQGKANFWCDLPPGNPVRVSHEATLSRHQDRVDNDILPAVADLLQSTAGAYENDMDYIAERHVLEAVIVKWRLVAGPVKTTEAAQTGDTAKSAQP